MNFGERLKSLRKERGLTQQELGEMCGLDRIMVSKYESGKFFPRKNNLEKLAQALGVPECELLKERSSWTPSYRPPEAGTYVLLSFENFSVPLVGRYEEDEYSGGGFYAIGDDDYSAMRYDLYVNAWMPLPKPYRGE